MLFYKKYSHKFKNVLQHVYFYLEKLLWSLTIRMPPLLTPMRFSNYPSSNRLLSMRAMFLKQSIGFMVTADKRVLAPPLAPPMETKGVEWLVTKVVE